MGKVTDTNLLAGTVRARLYVEDKPRRKKGEEEAAPSQEEQLSDDIYTYKKQDIRRLDKRKDNRKNANLFEGVDADTMKEIEELIKD